MPSNRNLHLVTLTFCTYIFLTANVLSLSASKNANISISNDYRDASIANKNHNLNFFKYPPTKIIQKRLLEYSNAFHISTYNWHLISKHLENEKNALQDFQRVSHSLMQMPQITKTQKGLTRGVFFQCPAHEEISPCICTTTDSTTLNCSDVNNFVQLKEILNNATFPSTNFDSFKYYPIKPNESEAILLNNTFGPLSFKNILIGESGLQVMEPAALNGSQDTLFYLLLDTNRNLHTVPFEAILKDYIHVKNMVIIKGLLQELPKLESSSLQFLDLNTNNISGISNDTFEGLTSLVTLDLSYNSIQRVSPGFCFSSFSPYIYINNNLLEEVDTFTCSLPFLLDESSNFLTTFSEEVYQPILDKGSFVDITSNNINCNELGWVANNPSYLDNVITDCTKN